MGHARNLDPDDQLDLTAAASRLLNAAMDAADRLPVEGPARAYVALDLAVQALLAAGGQGGMNEASIGLGLARALGVFLAQGDQGGGNMRHVLDMIARMAVLVAADVKAAGVLHHAEPVQ